MNPEAVFNRYDIRGDYPGEVDAEFAERLGRAVGTYAARNGRDKVVVGRDTRECSEPVHAAFIEGARGTGANVVDTGTGPTDRVALASSHYGGTGVMVTASHHAWERTGFKLLYEKGNGFSNQDLEKVKGLFQEQDFEHGDGTLIDVQHEFDEVFIEELQESFRSINGEELDLQVLLDASGSASRLAPALFEELGAEVEEHVWTERPSPEPSEESRSEVVESAEDYDAAFGYDPDGDRVYLVHPEIGWVDGDRLFYALAEILEPDSIAASIDTSPLIEETGAEVHYSRVGDIFVSEKGIETGADLLGEPNGHYALPAFSWYSSGILASLLLASEARRLPEILEPVKEYETQRHAEIYGSMEERDSALQDFKKRVAQNYDVVSTVDGVKFEGERVTGLVRPSGTSPKIRLIVHGKGDVQKKAEELQELLFG